MSSQHDNCPCMETCPLNRALTLIGGKWKMQILCSLHNNGPTRYNQLKRSLDGVSNTVLSAALRELEADGLVARQEYLEVPVLVEYAATPRSQRLIPILDALLEYGALSHQNGRPRRRFRRCSSPAPGALFTPLK